LVCRIDGGIVDRPRGRADHIFDHNEARPKPAPHERAVHATVAGVRAEQREAGDRGPEIGDVGVCVAVDRRNVRNASDDAESGRRRKISKPAERSGGRIKLRVGSVENEVIARRLGTMLHHPAPPAISVTPFHDAKMRDGIKAVRDVSVVHAVTCIGHDVEPIGRALAPRPIDVGVSVDVDAARRAVGAEAIAVTVESRQRVCVRVLRRRAVGHEAVVHAAHGIEQVVVGGVGTALDPHQVGLEAKRRNAGRRARAGAKRGLHPIIPALDRRRRDIGRVERGEVGRRGVGERALAEVHVTCRSADGRAREERVLGRRYAGERHALRDVVLVERDAARVSVERNANNIARSPRRAVGHRAGAIAALVAVRAINVVLLPRRIAAHVAGQLNDPNVGRRSKRRIDDFPVPFTRRHALCADGAFARAAIKPKVCCRQSGYARTRLLERRPSAIVVRRAVQHLIERGARRDTDAAARPVVAVARAVLRDRRGAGRVVEGQIEPIGAVGAGVATRNPLVRRGVDLTESADAGIGRHLAGENKLCQIAVEIVRHRVERADVLGKIVAPIHAAILRQRVRAGRKRSDARAVDPNLVSVGSRR